MLENLGAGAREKPIIDKKAKNTRLSRKKTFSHGFVDYLCKKYTLKKMWIQVSCNYLTFKLKFKF